MSSTKLTPQELAINAALEEQEAQGKMGPPPATAGLPPPDEEFHHAAWEEFSKTRGD